jgi:mono/diheme cytochrome c family protein
MRRQDSGPIEVRVPELSPGAQSGRLAFDRSCSACHGVHAAGSAKGPALVHRVYHPRLHADVAFDLAVQRGVRAHHWSFGDMPPQPAVTATELAHITRYIRELQKVNGIE